MFPLCTVSPGLHLIPDLCSGSCLTPQLTRITAGPPDLWIGYPRPKSQWWLAITDQLTFFDTQCWYHTDESSKSVWFWHTVTVNDWFWLHTRKRLRDSYWPSPVLPGTQKCKLQETVWRRAIWGNLWWKFAIGVISHKHHQVWMRFSELTLQLLVSNFMKLYEQFWTRDCSKYSCILYHDDVVNIQWYPENIFIHEAWQDTSRHFKRINLIFKKYFWLDLLLLLLLLAVLNYLQIA